MVIAVLAPLATPVLSQEAPPPGCRWQNGDGAAILACKDAEGYWRRSGDGEIVGYDPPRRRPPAAQKTAPATPVRAPVSPMLAPRAAAPDRAPAPTASAAAVGARPAPAEPNPGLAPNAPQAAQPVAPEAKAAAPEAGPESSAKAMTPEPPSTPPLTPIEAFFHWLLQLWRSLQSWIAGLS